jgi:two-component system response regulator DesR
MSAELAIRLVRQRGFLPKTVSAQVLADVVRTVHRGGRYVDPELAAVDEIARRAALTPGTVRNYLSSAAAKLGAANRHEAVQLARSRGWI